MAKRPENQLPPDLFYNAQEAQKYTNSTRIKYIQTQLTERCLELINLDNSKQNLVLDIGCGSGISCEILNDNDHLWIGVDISRDMLNVVDQEQQGDIYQIDLGQGLNFRHGTFDAAISVSALQWLCVASNKSHNPYSRLYRFFQSLYNCLKQGGRAALQFYPDGPEQVDMITKAAIKAGFKGGIVIDFPNSNKAKKIYLVIEAGDSIDNNSIQIIKGQDITSQKKNKANFTRSNFIRKKGIQKKPKVKSKQWILNKKKQMVAKGKDVKKDSKYSGRKRGLIRVLK